MSGEQINRKCWKDNVSEAKLLLTWSSTSLQIPSRPTLGFLHLMALFASMPCQSQQCRVHHIRSSQVSITDLQLKTATAFTPGFVCF